MLGAGEVEDDLHWTRCLARGEGGNRPEGFRDSPGAFELQELARSDPRHRAVFREPLGRSAGDSGTGSRVVRVPP